MDDIILKTTLDDSKSLYISAIDCETYAEHVADDNLGGADGYFVMVAHKCGFPRVEVLAKVPTLEAAQSLFDLFAGVQYEERRTARRPDYSTPLFR